MIVLGFGRIGHGRAGKRQRLRSLGEVERTLDALVHRAAHLDGVRMVVAAHEEQAVDGKTLLAAANRKGLNRSWSPEVIGSSHGIVVV
ncbi:hypothetical protein SDC9_157285 [bioreactor metagenome]|uniref:Uncharacterized protein n=1 Tax=bioreactor metagenome TaxID=1076179 RepID=A0A645F8V9_9ZZZZ